MNLTKHSAFGKMFENIQIIDFNLKQHCILLNLKKQLLVH